jgi:hypothetical protein
VHVVHSNPRQSSNLENRTWSDGTIGQTSGRNDASFEVPALDRHSNSRRGFGRQLPADRQFGRVEKLIGRHCMHRRIVIARIG